MHFLNLVDTKRSRRQSDPLSKSTVQSPTNTKPVCAISMCFNHPYLFESDPTHDENDNDLRCSKVLTTRRASSTTRTDSKAESTEATFEQIDTSSCQLFRGVHNLQTKSHL